MKLLLAALPQRFARALAPDIGAHAGEAGGDGVLPPIPLGSYPGAGLGVDEPREPLVPAGGAARRAGALAGPLRQSEARVGPAVLLQFDVSHSRSGNCAFSQVSLSEKSAPFFRVSSRKFFGFGAGTPLAY